MEVRGYKGFSSGLKNKYGAKFEEGVIYSKNPDTLRFGEGGHGYHMTSKLADTFRFFNPCLDNVYCEVVGSGKIIKQDNHLYNSDSMYAVENFEIVRVLSREDIFNYVCNCEYEEFVRFLSLYPFDKDELLKLRDLVIDRDKCFNEVFEDAINVRQFGDVKTFKRDRSYLRKF